MSLKQTTGARPPLTPALAHSRRSGAVLPLRDTPRACAQTVTRSLCALASPLLSRHRVQASALLRVRAPSNLLRFRLAVRPITHRSSKPQTRARPLRPAFTRSKLGCATPSPLCVLHHAHAPKNLDALAGALSPPLALPCRRVQVSLLRVRTHRSSRSQVLLRHAHALRPRCVSLCALASFPSNMSPRAGDTAARA
eukprot:6213847-Pleurochrysis_carterae.AAC.5